MGGVPARGDGIDTPLDLRFLVSAPTVADLPASPAEVAVAGRSNVGKSSLLNAMAGRKVARTSGTPGRTQLLNCFALAEGGTLVDLPGYGYAKAPRAARAAWQHRTDEYLVARTPLRMTMVLVDGEIGPTRLDTDMLAWLGAHGVPHAVVATKHDKVRSSRRERRRRDLASACGLGRDDVVWVSAATGVNLDRLREMVRSWLA